MTRAVWTIVLLLVLSVPGSAHDRETTSVTWNGAVSHIIAARCGSCHQEGGPAFSLMTYDQARPWAVAIRDEVLARTMPPWGAVKGFGEFRNDNALSAAQANLVVSWVEGGVPEGGGAAEHAIGGQETSIGQPQEGGLRAEGDFVLGRDYRLDGLWPEGIRPSHSAQVTVVFPDGRIEPLIWLYEYDSALGHAFLLKEPMALPAGTRIRGIPDGASLTLLPPPPVTYTGPPFVVNRPPNQRSIP